MTESTAAVAYEARNRANAAHDKIEAHEDLCAERYRNINESVAEIKNILKWAGSGIIGLMLTVLGWLVLQQIDNNRQDQAALARQLLELREQNH